MLTEQYKTRVAAVQSYYLSDTDLDLAVQHFNTTHNHPPNYTVSGPREFIRYNVRKFETLGSILNRPPPGRAPTVPEDIARECSTWLKQGYCVLVQHPTAANPFNLVWEHFYFTSIKQACQMHPQLHQTIEDFGVTPEYLLRCMHRVDPGLSYKTLHFKKELSPAQKAERQRVAATLLANTRADPYYLKGTFFADACKFVLVDSRADIRVYCDAHDRGATYVLPCQHLQHGERIHVHVLVIVNPILGLSWLEYTTGTDGIQRIRLPNIIYRVSG